jgi:hypothetical protein
MPANKSNRARKPTVKKRTINPRSRKPNENEGAPFNDADVKRRLGNFGGAGEHPRVGGRTTGIVGQTKSTFKAKRKPK